MGSFVPAAFASESVLRFGPCGDTPTRRWRATLPTKGEGKDLLDRGFGNPVANQLLVHEFLDAHVTQFAAVAGILDAAER